MALTLGRTIAPGGNCTMQAVMHQHLHNQVSIFRYQDPKVWQTNILLLRCKLYGRYHRTQQLWKISIISLLGFLKVLSCRTVLCP